MKRYLLPVVLLLPLLCVSCGESDQEKRDRAAQFTTPTKPAPNPQRESLQSLIRTDKQVPTTLQGRPKFELYSVYEGQDMRQVTEVSGRTLLICFTAPWCRHSNAMRKSLQELAEREKGGVQVVEINADDYPAIAEDYGIVVEERNNLGALCSNALKLEFKLGICISCIVEGLAGQLINVCAQVCCLYFGDHTQCRQEGENQSQQKDQT